MKPGSRADIALTLALAAAGIGSIGYGLWQVFPPAMWMFVGAAAIFVSGIGIGQKTPAAPAGAPNP